MLPPFSSAAPLIYWCNGVLTRCQPRRTACSCSCLTRQMPSRARSSRSGWPYCSTTAALSRLSPCAILRSSGHCLSNKARRMSSSLAACQMYEVVGALMRKLVFSLPIFDIPVRLRRRSMQLGLQYMRNGCQLFPLALVWTRKSVWPRSSRTGSAWPMQPARCHCCFHCFCLHLQVGCSLHATGCSCISHMAIHS